jgi:hypothetical protein
VGIAPTARPVIKWSMVAPLVGGLGGPAGPLGRRRRSDDSPTPTDNTGQATSSPTTTFSLPTVATTLGHHVDAPPTTIEQVVVPRLVGMRLTRAKASLADLGLTAKVTYKSTARLGL